jgi:hypothetical protein
MVGKTAWWLDNLRWAAEQCAKGDEDKATRDAIELLLEIDYFRRRLQEVQPLGLRDDLHDGVTRLASAAIWLGIKRSAKLIPFLEERAKRSEGGKKGAKSRSGEDTWRPHALELARQIRKENPSLSQKNLAAEIAKGWRLQIDCPKTQLILSTREWERSGELPKRTRQ